MIGKLFRLFEQALQANAKTSASSMVIAGALGTIVFGLYGVLWLYVTPLSHESFPMRLIGIVACLCLWLRGRWPARCRKYLPWLWFSTVTYALPFFSTYQLLASDYSLLRSMLEVATMFFIIGIFPNYALAGISLVLGMGFGALAAYLMVPDFWALNHQILLSVHLQVMAYVVVAGMIFMRSHLKGQLAQEKLDTLKSLTTCIALEMRNPINQIRYRVDLIQQRLPLPGITGEGRLVPAADLEFIYQEISRCRLSTNWGAQVVEMTMDEMGFTPIDKANFRHLSAAVVTRRAMNEFGYQTSGERDRVSLTVREDFVFRGDETRYLYVLFNLLKNAIFYFSEHPEAGIKIIVDDQSVTVEDTGPGMKPEVLARAFEPFHSVGKPGGTGLGLSFCKRTMRAFGGKITCESVPGDFTRFVMSFPRISNRDMAAYKEKVMEHAKTVLQGKNILIVDDSTRIRKTAREVLASVGALIDEAGDGQMALEMLTRKRYDAMLLDLSMPELDGYATAETIRRGGIPGQEHMPIAVHSSETWQPAKARLDRIGVDAFIPKDCEPLEMVEALSRAHASAALRQKTLAASSTLAGKTVLLADGESFSRKYVRMALQERGMKVIEASNDAAIMDALNGKRRVDVVLTDLQMPTIDGVGITRAIRTLAPPLCTTPVMAMSTNSKEALLSAAHEAGIDEVIAKPVDLMDLFQKLNRQLMVVSDADELARVLRDVRSKLDSLAAQAAANDRGLGQELMYAILELTGRINARAFHAELRAQYEFTREKGEWPAGDWVPRLRELFGEVERRFARHVPA